MTLFLYCVFNQMTVLPDGIEKHKLIHMTPKQYERIKYVAGKKPAVKLCRQAFGGTADSAWIETIEGEAVLEEGFGPFIETPTACPKTKASQSGP